MIPKYRLVDKVKKVIWNVESISWDFGAEVDFLHVDAFNDVGDTKTFLRQFELLQSTGLKDKYGVEIYDKDIVRDSYGDILLIEWLDGSFVLTDFFSGGYDHCSIDDSEAYEIVGNQFEHPHLLEE